MSKPEGKMDRPPVRQTCRRTAAALCLLTLPLSAVGCSVVHQVKHGLALQAAYNHPTDSALVRVRHCLLARSAWRQFSHSAPTESFSRHFKRGFKQGFIDVLTGGSGEPPVLPPEHYWTVFYRSPKGHQAIQDWFAGFRMGAEVAKQGGYRQWELIPTGVQASAADQRLPDWPLAGHSGHTTNQPQRLEPVSHSQASQNDQDGNPPVAGDETDSVISSNATDSQSATLVVPKPAGMVPVGGDHSASSRTLSDPPARGAAVAGPERTAFEAPEPERSHDAMSKPAAAEGGSSGSKQAKEGALPRPQKTTSVGTDT